MIKDESDLKMKDLRKSSEKLNREIAEYKENIKRALSGNTVAVGNLIDKNYGIKFWWNKEVGLIIGDEKEINKYGIS